VPITPAETQISSILCGNMEHFVFSSRINKWSAESIQICKMHRLKIRSPLSICFNLNLDAEILARVFYASIIIHYQGIYIWPAWKCAVSCAVKISQKEPRRVCVAATEFSTTRDTNSRWPLCI